MHTLCGCVCTYLYTYIYIYILCVCHHTINNDNGNDPFLGTQMVPKLVIVIVTVIVI